MRRPKNISLAKLSCPKVSGCLIRARLFSFFEKEKDRPITWIAGPGGAGKTTLVASYLEYSKIPALWYQVDQGDGDSATFFYYLGLAVKNAVPSSRTPLQPLTPEYLPNIAVFSRRFFESLFQKINAPFVLVFDNCQDAPLGAFFRDIVLQGLLVVPDGIQIFLISRSEPPQELAQLRAKKRMNYLGWEELKFNFKEAEALVRSNGRIRPDAQHVKLLWSASDGWAAGMVLMLERQNIQKIKSESQRSFSREEVFEYFASEVLERSGRKTKELLLKTAYLPKITADFASKLTGIDEAGHILSELARHNYFTTRHGLEKPVYQYHPLFREFLAAHAVGAFSKEYLSGLKIKAADLLVESEQHESAIELYLEVGEFENAATVMRCIAPVIFAQGRFMVLKGWINALPRGVADRSADILYLLGVCLMPLNPAESKINFEKAFDLFKTHGNRSGMFLSWAGAVDAAFFGAEFIPLDAMILRLESMLRADPTYPSANIEAQVIVSMFGALSTRQPYHHDISSWEKQTMKVLRTTGDLDLLIKAGTYLTVYYLWIGAFPKAGLTLDLMRMAFKTGKASDLMLLTLMTTEALYDFFTARCESCLKKVNYAVKFGQKTGVRVWENHVLGHGIVAALSRGDLTTAERLLVKMDLNPKTIKRLDAAYYFGAQTWKALIESDLNAAKRYCFEFENIIKRVGDIPTITVADIVLFEMLYEAGSQNEAKKHLKHAYGIARKMKSRIIEYMCRLVEAHIAFKNRKDRTGLKLLRIAMILGREGGFMNMYWWRPVVMAELCAKALSAGIETAYVQNLVRSRGLLPPGNSIVPPDWPFPIRVRTLGKFEIWKDGKPVVFSGKVQQKPLALFKALIAFGGIEVPEGTLTDVLWPEADGYSAHRSFESALYRLRVLLGNEKAVQLQDGKLSLSSTYCRVDVWTLSRLFKDAELNWGQKDHAEKMNVKNKRVKKKMEVALPSTQAALVGYAGRFLPGDASQAWTATLRDSLHNKFIHHTNKLGRFWEDSGDFENAVLCYQRGLEIDDLCEEFYQRTMICLDKLGRKSEAVTTYHRCRKRLSAALDITPSSVTEDIYHAIRHGA